MTCGRCGQYLPHPGKAGCPQRPSRKSRPSRKNRPSETSRPSRFNRSSRENRPSHIVLSRLPVIGVDSEAQGDLLTMFVAANERGESWSVSNAKGLTADQVFRFLLSLPRGITSAFFFDYDVSMVLKCLPDYTLEALRKNGETQWGQWKIEHIPSKIFRVSSPGLGSRTIWDAGGWAQCSFAKLIADWGLGTKSEREFISRMKAKRNVFSELKASEILRYSKLECKLLAQWVRGLLTLHESLGLTLKSYCGAGSTAAAILRRRGFEPPPLPPEVERAASASYFGGRSEIAILGAWTRPVAILDINSAYPSALSAMPAIGAGTWKKTKRLRPGDWGFALVRWRLPEGTRWGPFPVRAHKTEAGRVSSLIYPLRGIGWYHTSEVEQCPEAEVIEAWILDDSGERPFAWIETLIAERLEYKAAGDMRHLPLKLGLNSLYGKLAQRTGKAQYRSVALAAAITAITRAKLYSIARRFPDQVFLLATDGIIASQKIDGLDYGAGLGQWDYQSMEDCFIAQSGVYWTGPKLRTRGFEMRNIDSDAVRLAWEREGTNMEVGVSTRRFIGYRAALHRGRRELLGTWESGVRYLKMNPYPRRKPDSWSSDKKYLRTLPCELHDFSEASALDMLFHDISKFASDDEQPDWVRD